MLLCGFCVLIVTNRLLPDWVPFAPWRWWIHLRQVFLPMSFIYSSKFSHPPTPLTLQLREELYTKPYDSIDFPTHRNSISPRDNYHPKSLILCIINWILVYIWLPLLRPVFLKKKAEAWTFKLIQYEDENTEYACLGPVNGPMNTLACYVHDGPSSESVNRHRDRLQDFLWMKNEGMLMNGTNGVQTWDTSLTVQAVLSAGLGGEPEYRPMLTKALEFLEDQQIRENCREQDKCYRQRRKGAWAFSTRTQGYTVSDCTSEALKAVMMLQAMPEYPQLVSSDRQRDAIDTLLTMQNASGGFASYEPQRGSEYMELLNAAEVFGRIMVEYDYPECSTAVITALKLFSTQPGQRDYRAAEIRTAIDRARGYILHAQRPDGSWYGSWGICFTYAAMFALESLAAVDETCASSSGKTGAAARGCAFLISKQLPDGGWGESYRGCETGTYTHHPSGSQVVMTAWAVIGLLAAEYPDRKPIERGVRLIMSRQEETGGWAQEGIEGVFNKSVYVLISPSYAIVDLPLFPSFLLFLSLEPKGPPIRQTKLTHSITNRMISYPNYKYIFPAMALGMFVQKYGDMDILS